MYWWERSPELLRDEIEALRNAGARPVPVEEAFANGHAEIRVNAAIRGKEYEILIKYPDLFPYFRPEFFCKDLGASGHYNPIIGHMCLLTRGTAYWTPGMKAADLFIENLPNWEVAAFTDRTETPITGEDLQAEPFTAYYGVSPFMTIMMDSKWEIPETTLEGTLKIIFRNKLSQSVENERLLGLVLSIDDTNDVIHQVPDNLIEWAIDILDKQTIIDVPWIKLNKLIESNDPNDFLAKIKDVAPDKYQRIASRLGQFSPVLCGFTFKEERARGVQKDGWIFLLGKQTLTSKKKPRKFRSFLQLVRSEPYGSFDYFERINNIYSLQTKRVAVFGLGCLGSASAVMLAQSGVSELVLTDKDVITPSTTCRTTYSIIESGLSKMEVMANYLSKNFPFTNVLTNLFPSDQNGKPFPLINLGQIDGSYNQYDYLDVALDGVDLIFDATAEEGIHHLLADLAHDKGIPIIFLSSRHGGMGGLVARLKPDGSNGCFACFAKHKDEETFPQAPEDLDAHVQPGGCADVTFKATVFDVREIALTAVRLAVSTLCEGAENSYPATDWDVAIMSLVEEGKMLVPTWKTYPLMPHPDCQCQKR